MIMRAGILGAAAAMAWAVGIGAAPWSLSAAVGEDQNNVRAVAYHCWRRDGVRHCRLFHPSYGYLPRHPIYNDPGAYRLGTNRWWQEMDRQNRGGRL
jgi:hypothetical protein